MPVGGKQRKSRPQASEAYADNWLNELSDEGGRHRAQLACQPKRRQAQRLERVKGIEPSS